MNDLDLCEELIRVKRNATALDEMERENRHQALEDALTVIERSAREARRTLRKLPHER